MYRDLKTSFLKVKEVFSFINLPGGGEELDWTMSVLFDAMGALSSKYNDTPKESSRAYDANSDGFLIA